MEAVAAVQTVGELVGVVVQVIRKIRGAIKDVNDLPTNIQELLKLVERLDPLVVKIQDNVQNKEDELSLKALLQKLDADLRQASKKVDEFMELKHQHKIVKITLAIFNQGAAKQQKEIKAICEAIERTREELDKMLNIGTYFTVEATHSIVRNMQVTGEYSVQMGEQLVSGVESLHWQIHQLQREPPPRIVEPPSIIADLDRWAVQCLTDQCITDECYKVKILLAESHSRSFFPPGQGSESPLLRHPPSFNRVIVGRIMRVGGWEVTNSTKIQLQFTVKEDCYFYLLHFEKGLPITTDVELIFPESAASKNEVVRAVGRTFPDIQVYESDPPTFKVEKSTLLKDGTIGQVLVYIVLSDKPLIQDGQEKVDIINDIKKQLTFKKENSHVSYVKKVLFEVK